MTGLPKNWKLTTDKDGDWWLVPPENITIVSLPGEAYFIGTCSEEVALSDAEKLVSGWGYLAPRSTPPLRKFFTS